MYVRAKGTFINEITQLGLGGKLMRMYLKNRECPFLQLFLRAWLPTNIVIARYVIFDNHDAPSVHLDYIFTLKTKLQKALLPKIKKNDWKMTMTNVVIFFIKWRWRWRQTSLKIKWWRHEDLAVSVNDTAPWFYQTPQQKCWLSLALK